VQVDLVFPIHYGKRTVEVRSDRYLLVGQAPSGNIMSPVAREEELILSNNLSVRDLMTQDVLRVERNQKLSTADDIMRLGRVRHVLVVDEEGALQGVVSQRDLFHGGLLRALGYGTRAKEQALDSLLVKEAMKSDPITTTPDASLQSAASLMAQHKIGCLPVLEAGRVVGILTEGDFVLMAAGTKAGAPGVVQGSQ
jgi:CBS domain-containing protein